MRLGVAAAVVGGVLVRGDVEIADGCVAAVGVPGAGAGLAVPGLVDLQVNGYAGVDVLDAEPAELLEMGRALARDGVLWYQPTLITAPLEKTLDALQAVGRALESPSPARILGAHLEGPFLSPDRAGAHPPALLRAPDADLLEAYLAAGPVTMVTVAPELDGALELVETLAARGIVVSLGHTNANAALAREAFDRGAASVTHLFNAMRQFHHRDPGIVGAALTRQDVVVQLIADGVHVDPEAVLAAWHVARGRLVLVSDAIAAAGGGDGTTLLGGIAVTVAGGVARTADGELAGGVFPLSAGLRLLLELDVPLVEAVDAVTGAPARLLGRTDVGVLAVGAPADLVVVDDGGEVERVYAGGELVA